MEQPKDIIQESVEKWAIGTATTMKSGVGSLQILVPKPIQNALKLKDRDTLLIKVQKVGEGKPKRKDVAKNLKHGKQENPMQKQPVVKLPKIEMFGDLEEWE